MIRLTDNLTAYNCDNLELLAVTPAKSVDVICIDPPYLYLKNQKLERPFDAPLFFTECRRVLKDTGFIVMFGRGSTFYRWNVLLEDLGLIFKEEVIWNKKNGSSPLTNLLRVHETVSIFGKRKAIIRKSRVPYLEAKAYKIESILRDLSAVKSLVGEINLEAFSGILKGASEAWGETVSKKGTTKQTGIKNRPQGYNSAIAIKHGAVETSIIELSRAKLEAHPTQKPARLIERLLAIVVPQNVPPSSVMVADYFGGSFSLLRACYNAGYTGVACEIDEEYYSAGVKATRAYIEQKETEFLKSF